MKIAILGDLLLKNPEDNKLGERLHHQLHECDIRIINFEVPIETENANGIHKSGPVHCQSRRAPEWLISYGFNLITLANNHSLDYGETGLRNTLGAFRNISVTGIGNYQTAYEPLIIEKEGVKIGFLGLTHKEWGCVDSMSGEKLGTACITSPKAVQAIVEASHKADRLYVLAHAGVEHIEVPLPEWREVYKSFIDLGASGVIASHPHVPQGYETYKGCPIIYSLGNFLFEIKRPDLKEKKWFISLMVVLSPETNEYKAIPLFYDYRRKEVEIDDSKETQDYINYLCTLLTQERYNEKLEEELDKLRTIYQHSLKLGGLYPMSPLERIKDLIKPIVGKKRFKADYVHGLNLFQCESHRWTMMRLLKKIIP